MTSDPTTLSLPPLQNPSVSPHTTEISPPFHRTSIANTEADDDRESYSSSSTNSGSTSHGSPGPTATSTTTTDAMQSTSVRSNGQLADQNKNRAELFQLVERTVAILRERREDQDRQEALFMQHLKEAEAVGGYTMEEEIQAIGDSSDVGRKQKKGFYYKDLTEEEDALLDQLVAEVQEVKARRDVKLDPSTVQGSFALLLQMENLTEFGVELYSQMWREEVYIPRQMALMTREERITAIFKIINVCVGLYDKPNDMFEKLTHEGTVHRLFGVTVHSFHALRNAFMYAFKKCAPPEVYDASVADWTNFWKLAVNLMTQGSLSTEGERLGKIFIREWTQELQKHLYRIKESNDKHQDVKEHFIYLMFQSAIKEDPSLEEKFKHVYTNRRVCQRQFDTIASIANTLDNTNENDALLFELGGRHVTYGVTKEQLTFFTPHFLHTIQHFLKEEYTDPVMYYFKKLYEMIIDGMAAGMDAGKNFGENRRAPDGSAPFCLMFTDIESSTNLWQWNSDIMKKAVAQHHRIIRTIIADYGGYEVKTAGDSFLIAAKDMLVGLKIAVAIQLELMRNLPIVPGFEMLDEVQGGGDPSAWSNQTLRVRIGMEHCTQATATYDTIHRRYDYYGPSVNQCARIEAAAAGGQILMSRESFKALKAIPEFHTEPCPPYLRDLSGATPMDDRGLDHFVAVCDVGKAKLKGIKKKVKLFSLTPIDLSGRAFDVFS